MHSLSAAAQILPPATKGWFGLEEIYHAYRSCRRRKRGTHNALAFEADLEENLLDLYRELNDGSYRPQPFLAFLVERPKRREIFAAEFRDRVVHHLVVNRLEPSWERHFIYDSFACRRGKGTHKAVARLRAFCRKASHNNSARAWYLQLDIKGFFVAIDRQVLFDLLVRREPDPASRWLAARILDQQPTEACRFRNTASQQLLSLPPHKSLFHAPRGQGLPIGNLTSQFSANVYLDALDQFVKHRLKARYYLRYCDDLVLVSARREELLAWETAIKAFLNQELGLLINQRRRLCPVQDGIDWLGYIVRPDYLLVRRRVVNALYRRLGRAEKALRKAGLAQYPNGRLVYPWPQEWVQRLEQWLNAYLAHVGKARHYRLLMRLWRDFWWLGEYFRISNGGLNCRCPVPNRATSVHQQRCWFERNLPGHLILYQTGAYWRCWSGDATAELAAGALALPGKFCSKWFGKVRASLWEGCLPVAWVAETGERNGYINQRALYQRWPANKRGTFSATSAQSRDEYCFSFAFDQRSFP